MIWIRLVSILAAAGIAASAGPIYTLTDLGTLGGSSAMATSVNSFGQSVGTMTSAQGDIDAFTSSGVISDAQANGINDAGEIAGTQFIAGQTYATVWSNGAASTVGGAGSYALAINNAGDVAGMLVNNGLGNAFITQNGTVIDLGVFDGGFWSAAYSVNDAGQAAGDGITSTGNFQAFLWTPAQGYAVLGTLGGAASYALSINDSGAVVGSAQTAAGYLHATEWNGTVAQDLGTLGGISSSAYGINDLGNVVGTSFTTGNAVQDGFLEEGGVMYDINALLIDAPGWVITDLYAINDSNQIVGTGILNGVEHAVLLTDPPAPTPEPASWISALAGLLGLSLRLRRTGRTSR
ncbi:MAG: hypothetical protein ABSF22_19555 [Bryobacteraceae bacterium]